MGRSQANEFSGCYDFGSLPESREVPEIACHQIVRTRRIGAFQEDVVVGIARDVQAPCRNDRVTVSFDDLEQLLAMDLANPQFRAPKHLPVLRKNGTGHVEASRL